MASRITTEYWTRQPITIGVAVLVHGVVMLLMPAGGLRVSAAANPDSFVDIVTVEVPEPEPLVVPEPPRPVPREVEREVVAEEPTAAPVEHPVEAAAPQAETPAPVEAAPPPVETITAGSSTDSASGFHVTEGSAGGSVTTTVASNGTTEGAAPAVVDVRALARDYRRQVGRAIGNIPPLRGGIEVEDARVLVGFRISADGNITNVRIVRSSGHPMVDAHVLEFVRTIRHVPAPPPELRLDLQELVQPIDC